jgi:hypothetical protein
MKNWNHFLAPLVAPELCEGGCSTAKSLATRSLLIYELGSRIAL